MARTPSHTLAQRYAEGIKLRRKVARQNHADLLGPADRDPVAILAAGDRTRLPNLIPVRYQRMLASPFAFLRGAAAVMAQDLRHQPGVGIAVHACGDCHLMNFGAFATPEENILFDINDFDETLPGVDFTVDLKRLAASVAVAALAEGFSKNERVQLRQQRLKAIELACAPWRSCRPWKFGTAGSIWRVRSNISRIVRSDESSTPSSPRPARDSSKMITFRTW